MSTQVIYYNYAYPFPTQDAISIVTEVASESFGFCVGGGALPIDAIFTDILQM